MIRLLSKDKFDDLVLLNPETGQMEWSSRSKNPEWTTMPFKGALSKMDGHIFCLYRNGDSLHFRIDDQDFELDEHTDLDLRRNDVRNDVNVLSIVRNGQSLLTLTYKVPQPVVVPLDDPTPFVEEEDFDFGLFASNVCKNSQRRDRIFQGEDN